MATFMDLQSRPYRPLRPAPGSAFGRSWLSGRLLALVGGSPVLFVAIASLFSLPALWIVGRMAARRDGTC